jgi:hypothetical protein
MPSLGPSHVRPPLGGSGVASDTTLESFFSKLHSHSSDALRRVDRFLLLAVLFCRLPSQLTRDAFPTFSYPSYSSRPSSPPPLPPRASASNVSLALTALRRRTPHLNQTLRYHSTHSPPSDLRPTSWQDPCHDKAPRRQEGQPRQRDSFRFCASCGLVCAHRSCIPEPAARLASLRLQPSEC